MLQLLIIGGSPLCKETISLALSSPHFELHTLDSTQCVVEACDRRRFDLLIFLTLTPYFTTMNICTNLKSRLHKMPKIYVISHSHCCSTILSLLECGVNQYMTFPVNLGRLRSKVDNLLNE